MRPSLHGSSLQLGVRVSHFRQICCSRARVQFAQQAVVSGLRLPLRNVAVRVVDVAEDDCARGARLLAGGLQLFADMNVFAFAHAGGFGVNAALVDALDAVRTLFHDAAAAHADVGIAHHLVLRRIPILQEEEVEAAYFVGTVIRTIPRAHAAVVDHVVQAFGRVIGRAHRADDFTGRVFALHAGHGLEERLRIVAIAFVVGVDANPVHVAADVDLLFADDGNVVLGLAGDHAVVAADTFVEIDRHAPGIFFFFIGIWRVEREIVGRLFFLGEVRLFFVFLERGLADQRTLGAIGRIHGLHALRGGKLVGGSGFGDLQARGDPRIGAGAKFVGVEALRGTDAASMGASVAEGDGDGVVGMPGLNPDSALSFLPVEFEFDYVIHGEVKTLGHLGADLDGIVPGELRHRLGEFLEPAVVGELSVVDGGVAADVELDGGGVGGFGSQRIPYRRFSSR